MHISYSESIYYSIRLTSRYFKAFIEQFLDRIEANITSDEIFTLDILKCNGVMCQRDLAKLLFKDRANTGKIAQSLQEKGYINIKIEEKNNRLVKNLLLTKKGEDLLKNLEEKSIPILNELTNHVSLEEYKYLQNTLSKIRQNIKEIITTQI